MKSKSQRERISEGYIKKTNIEKGISNPNKIEFPTNKGDKPYKMIYLPYSTGELRTEQRRERERRRSIREAEQKKKDCNFETKEKIRGKPRI